MPKTTHRMVFMGSPDFAVPILDFLNRHPQIELVQLYCQPPKPQGRGQKEKLCATHAYAIEHQIAVSTPKRLKDGVVAHNLKELQLDAILVAAYGRILPLAILKIPKRGCINVHGSLLPRWRGASPIAHAILHADQQTGICLMQMDEGLDTGGVFGQKSIPITDEDTSESLTHKLSQTAIELLEEQLLSILEGKRQAIPQSQQGICHARLLQKNDGLLDFSQPAASLQRQIRAFDPWPGCFTFCETQRLQILKSYSSDTSQAFSENHWGQVIQHNQEGIAVATSLGLLWITSLKPAGKKAMAAADWLRGKNQQQGDVFFTNS